MQRVVVTDIIAYSDRDILVGPLGTRIRIRLLLLNQSLARHRLVGIRKDVLVVLVLVILGRLNMQWNLRSRSDNFDVW